ncbi:hypothetical protein KGE16_002898 [Listeria monocytogenes]|nr:hypothetical protein [Listeria monocytogenes]EHM3395712.1 hypothetical protein [Listeria monocytogenes]EIA3997720.1 hypothetical protein [Listeria monocytogenes]
MDLRTSSSFMERMNDVMGMTLLLIIVVIVIVFLSVMVVIKLVERINKVEAAIESDDDLEMLKEDKYEKIQNFIREERERNQAVLEVISANCQKTERQLSQIYIQLTSIIDRLEENQLVWMQIINSTNLSPDVAMILLLSEELAKVQDQYKLLEQKCKDNQLLVFAKEPSNEVEKE